ncbi:MAG: hypothetical protein ACHQ3P_05240 [Candidatus Limnocylindrales bacterium]
MLVFLVIVAGLILLGEVSALYGEDSRFEGLDPRGPTENPALL